MSSNLVKDHRLTKGQIYNLAELLAKYEVPSPDQLEGGLDQFLYLGVEKYGPEFLRNVSGKFAAVYHDQEKSRLFVARDWIGEVPLHWILTYDAFICANSIGPLTKYPNYRYNYVVSAPHGMMLNFDTAGAYRFPTACGERNLSWDVSRREYFYDFPKERLKYLWDGGADGMGEPHFGQIRTALMDSVVARYNQLEPDEPVVVLLSGGIDSLTIGYCLSQLSNRRVIAYTVSLEGRSDDAHFARKFVDHFGWEMREVDVTAEEVLKEYEPAVELSELYHLGNTYCAVGMLLLGQRLKADGIKTVFCGEGVNEALGDYTPWYLADPTSGKSQLIQDVDFERLQKPSERERYVWGRIQGLVRYNRQLGSGLAKHGVSRMVKPLMNFGVELECPYLNPKVMSLLVGIPSDQIKRLDGKGGLMSQVFSQDIESDPVYGEFINNSQKVRLQDGSVGGADSISQILFFRGGYNQARTIEVFNKLFKADLDPVVDGNRLHHVST